MTAKRDYLNDFLKLAREDTKQFLDNENTLKYFQRSIEQWLKTKERLDKKLLIQYNFLKKDDIYNSLDKDTSVDLTSSGLREVLNKYINLKRKIKDIRDIEDITEHFKKGYELIHRIREIITGQDITYLVLYDEGTNKTGQKLMEAHLTLDQILSNVSIALSDIKQVKANQELTNAISLNISNSAIKKIANNLINQKENKLKIVTSHLDKPNLWDSLVKYRTRMIGLGVSKYTANFGRIYEVYTILRKVNKYQSINYIGKGKKSNTKGLANTLLKDAIENNDPGWQIGDVGLEQLKSVFNAEASLMSVSTIEKILKDTQNAFKLKSAEELSAALKKIFTTQRVSFNNELDEEAELEAIDKINKFITSLGFDIK